MPTDAQRVVRSFSHGCIIVSRVDAAPDDELDWKSFGLSFANRLRYLRSARYLTQEQLAERTGLHRNQISNLERNTSRDNGTADPMLSTVYRLAQALRVGPALLLPDAQQPVSSPARESTSDLAWTTVRMELDEAVAAFDNRPATH